MPPEGFEPAVPAREDVDPRLRPLGHRERQCTRIREDNLERALMKSNFYMLIVCTRLLTLRSAKFYEKGDEKSSFIKAPKSLLYSDY